MTTEEKIMVCVHCGVNSERLIQRGNELAQLLECSMVVLSVLPEREADMPHDQKYYAALWKQRCEELGVALVLQPDHDRKPADVIIDIARDLGITQIVIGQSKQSLWEKVTRGCFVNDLIHGMGEIDLHIVSSQWAVDHLA